MRQTSLQLGLYLRPLVVQNAEINRIAGSPAPRQQMPPQSTFLFCADAQNRVARLLVQSIGLEFHPHALPHFKSVPQHQVFRLGINAPREISVHRKEVYDAIRRENRAAAQVKPEDLSGLGKVDPKNPGDQTKPT